MIDKYAGKSIILIGMPGAGKSTVGVLLAKRLARPFVDVDLLIQSQARQSLQQIIDAGGMEEFCRLEERRVRELTLTDQVVATGGSVVYSEQAMRHLDAGGLLVHLSLPLEDLRRRLGDLHQRGVVAPAGETLEQLYARRMPLYQRWARLTVDCHGLDHEGVVNAIIVGVRDMQHGDT